MIKDMETECKTKFSITVEFSFSFKLKFEGIEHLFAMLRLLWYTVIVKNGG